MEYQDGRTDKEQYVDTKYVREHLMVSRTKAYDIVKEIEEYAPGAVFRFGRCLRVRKDVLFRWISEQVAGGKDLGPAKRPDLRLTG